MGTFPRVHDPRSDYNALGRELPLMSRIVRYQIGIFLIQWGLMILGFGILTKIVAPLKLLAPSLPFGAYFDAGVKALIALAFSVFWLLLWDRQVRYYFYRHRR